MGFSRFWLTMADKEIKVHRRVIRMIFPMIHRAKNNRLVRRALPVYDNDVKTENSIYLLNKFVFTRLDPVVRSFIKINDVLAANLSLNS